MLEKNNQYNNITRYSNDDLEEFRLLVEKKIAKAQKDLLFMEEQIQDMTDRMDSDNDWIDETANHSEREMLSVMAGRQRKHLQDLEYALLRINNKTYGICAVTGELIDKRRLLAVPTTTKSLAVKTAATQAMPKPAPKPTASKSPSSPKIFSRVIKKASTTSPANIQDGQDKDEWDEEDDFYVDTDGLDLFDEDDNSED